MKNIVVIGVSGGSASGKTTVVNRLKDICKDRVELISHDFYYKPFEKLTPEERTQVNYDHPDAFDTQSGVFLYRKHKTAGDGSGKSCESSNYRWFYDF